MIAFIESITHSPALAKWRSGGKWRLLGLGHRNQGDLVYNRGIERCYAGLSSLLRAKREPEMVHAPVRGGERFFIKANCSLLMSKENQKTTSDFDALDPTGCGTQRPLRALGGTRVLLTAAPTAPPCFRRRRRSSPLQERGCSPLSDPEGEVEVEKC